MIKIGLTGGIGSGKTTVSNVFESLGVKIYNSDQQAAEIMQRNLVEPIKTLLGESVVDENGVLIRPEIARIVFSNEKLLDGLNKIVHPAVINHFLKWAEQQEGHYVIFENAILFEHNFDKLMDQTVLVTADLETRLERVMKRDNTSREAILKRVAHQLPQEEIETLANHKIDSTTLITPQVIKTHKMILSKQ